MKISVQVKPNSKTPSVQVNDDGSYTVRVNAQPVDGKANAAVVEILAEYFDVSRSKILLLKGVTSKKKQFEILD